MPIAKTPSRTIYPPGICESLVVRHGPAQGQVLARCKPAGRTIRIYEAQWTLDPNGNDWIDLGTFCNSRAFDFNGLPRGKDVWIRVRARNIIGPGPWSDPATIMVTWATAKGKGKRRGRNPPALLLVALGIRSAGNAERPRAYFGRRQMA